MNSNNIFLWIIFFGVGIIGCKKDIIKNNIPQYYSAINKAELFICTQQLDSALLYYNIAFNNIYSPFAIDVNNALTCAVMERSYKIAQQYAKVLIIKGCSLAFFTKRSLHQEFVNSQEFKELEADYPSLNQLYKAKINEDLITELNFIFKRDQAYRGEGGDADKMLKIDDENKIRLSTIINQYGFPQEDKIGLTIVNDTFITDANIYIVFRHYFQNGNKYLKDTLLHFVKSGDLPASNLGSWLGTRPDYPIGQSVLAKLNDTLYKYMHPGIMETIEDNRKQLLLEPHKDLVTKTIFEYCDGLKEHFYITEIITPNSLKRNQLPPDLFQKVFKKIGTCPQK